MNKVQTDNDAIGFGYKVILRQHSLSDRKRVKVLDCYAGHGWVWNAVKSESECEIEIVQIDKKSDKSVSYLRGDNLKFLQTMDLDRFDIIDLDAYGTPIKQLNLLFEKGYKGIVHCTFIQTVMGRLPNDLLRGLNYSPEMVVKCPTLFSRNGFEKCCKYLYKKGLRDILYLEKGRKTYFYFNMGTL